MLAPAKNYLYKGSNARKTVRDILDAKQEFDAALLYEAITNKKFDVPVTRQDFTKGGLSKFVRWTYSGVLKKLLNQLNSNDF